MIDVYFTDDSERVTVKGLWQFDTRQTMYIHGLDLPPVVQIEFSLDERGGDSIPYAGITKNGVTEVLIPEWCLWTDDIINYKVYAFIYVTQDGGVGETIKKVIFPIQAKPRPVDKLTPEEAPVFQQIIDLISHYANEARESEYAAEGYAHGLDILPERDEDNAKYYSEVSKRYAEIAESTGIEYVAKIKEVSTQEQQSIHDVAATEKQEISALDASVRRFVDEKETSISGMEERAKASEDSARASAAASATSASESATSASQALASEGKAKTSEANAKTSETNAKTSETNAKASETEAIDSKNKALTSETNAKASELAAKTSETEAKSARDTTIATKNTAIADIEAKRVSALESIPEVTAMDAKLDDVREHLIESSATQPTSPYNQLWNHEGEVSEYRPYTSHELDEKMNALEESVDYLKKNTILIDEDGYFYIEGDDDNE